MCLKLMEKEGVVDGVERRGEIEKNLKSDALTVHVREDVVLDLQERSFHTIAFPIGRLCPGKEA